MGRPSPKSEGRPMSDAVHCVEGKNARLFKGFRNEIARQSVHVNPSQIHSAPANRYTDTFGQNSA